VCGREEPHIIGEVKALHQIRDELLVRKAAERPVFGWDDDVVTARRGSEKLSPGEAVQRGGGGDRRNPKCRLCVARGKEVASARDERV